MVQAIYADYYGRRSLGLIRGAFQPVQLGMNAAGPFAAGLWFDRTGSYSASFTLFAVLFVVAATAIAFASSEEEHLLVSLVHEAGPNGVDVLCHADRCLILRIND